MLQLAQAFSHWSWRLPSPEVAHAETGAGAVGLSAALMRLSHARQPLVAHPADGECACA